VRALEVCLLTGRPFSSFKEQWAETPTVRAVLVTRNREELYAGINRRTMAMFSAGVVEEVRTLGEIGPTAAQAIGLREIRELLAGRLLESECIARIQQQTRNYAKRQLTWFRKETHFQTVELRDGELTDSDLNRVLDAFEF
jgi:tRNA dimethylallyltransferase